MHGSLAKKNLVAKWGEFTKTSLKSFVSCVKALTIVNKKQPKFLTNPHSVFSSGIKFLLHLAWGQKIIGLMPGITNESIFY